MKVQWKKLLLLLAIPLAVGGLSALLSGPMDTYAQMEKPPLSPPGWVFPVVWTVLYLLMGYSSYLIATSDADQTSKKKALVLYGAQLAANFVWSLIFFRAGMPLAAFLWLIFLWVLIFMTIRAFSRISERAADLLLPYLLWVTFAGYLNFGIFLLN